MAATSRRRRICCRSAGAWATAAPRASPRPGPPRSPPRTSSPGSTSRRRCPWPRTQVSAGREGPRGAAGVEPAPALLSPELSPQPSLSLPGSGQAAVPARSEVSRPRGRGGGSSGSQWPSRCPLHGAAEAAQNGLAPCARPAEPQPRKPPPAAGDLPGRTARRFPRGQHGCCDGSGGGRGGPGRRAGARARVPGAVVSDEQIPFL